MTDADEFLETLLHLARLYGWRGDYIEVYDFVSWVHNVAGVSIPDKEPYVNDDDYEEIDKRARTALGISQED